MNAISNVTSWKKMITEMTEKSKQLWPLLKTDYGYKYTVNDDAEKQPAGSSLWHMVSSDEKDNTG
ncbi:MAG: hypothetical protein HWD62_00570 [Cyclobacteriaceae bacterium]|nr:MAG: hypothetical protein HWD62_00570 [Cyclobacteriaceae bacterium]